MSSPSLGCWGGTHRSPFFQGPHKRGAEEAWKGPVLLLQTAGAWSRSFLRTEPPLLVSLELLLPHLSSRGRREQTGALCQTDRWTGRVI